MDAETPARAGWRLALENPRLVVVEIAWRWSFGVAGALVLWWVVVSTLHRIWISDAQWAALRTLDMRVTPDILARIVIIYRRELLFAIASLLSALALLWTIAAAWGRSVTLKILGGPSNTWAVAGLTLLRVLLFLVALLAAVFSVGSAAWVSTSANAAEPNWTLYLLIVFIALPLIMVVWAILNWVLSLAPLFAVEGQKGVLAPLGAAFRSVRFSRNRYWSASGSYGLLRGAALVVLIVVGAILAALSQSKAMLALLCVLLLVYFAFADLLYVARMAAYLQIVQKQLRVADGQSPVDDQKRTAGS
jgi:hypothetical protein